VVVVAPQAPAAPTNFTATANGAGQIDLSWAAVDGATGYIIDRSADGVTGWSQVVTMVASSSFPTTFSDVGLADGTTYYYEIFAVNAAGVSSASPVVIATTETPPPLPPVTPPTTELAAPEAPTNLTARSPSRWRIALNWNDNSTRETGYIVERSSDGVNWSMLATLPGNTTTYTATRQTRGQVYYFRVCAINSAGASEYSNVVSTVSGAAAASTTTTTTKRSVSAAVFADVKKSEKAILKLVSK
jgi:large repetitive protein